MKISSLLATCSLCLLSTAALAADLPSRRAPPVFVPPPIPVFSWTGAYVGGTAGYAFDSNNALLFNGNQVATQGTLTRGVYPTVPGFRSDGFTGGGTIGYNFSTQSLPVVNGLAGGLAGGFGGAGLVIGVEADAAYTDLNSGRGFTGTNGFGSTIGTRTDFVGTARGRLGVAFDRLLVYGTGGFAYGGVRDNVQFRNGAGAAVFTGNQNKIQTGYAYGGGVEYALPTTSFVNVFGSSAVTLKAEYLHYDLGRSSFGVNGAAGSFTARDRVTGDLVRAGLNFKFGAPVVPVVARY